MDIYVVLDGARVVGASARLQGAELIRVDEAKRIAPLGGDLYDDIFTLLTIVNTELQDCD